MNWIPYAMNFVIAVYAFFMVKHLLNSSKGNYDKEEKVLPKEWTRAWGEGD